MVRLNGAFGSVLLFAGIAACGSGDVGVCDDPSYGDGTCDIDGACGMVDIDCLTTFESQAEAQTWFGELEGLIAQQESRPPRPLVPASDPRFAPMRALLDEGWAAYKATHNVGELAEHVPQLVIVDTSVLNLGAFVAPDHRTQSQTAGFAVMVETDLLERGPTDDELLAVVMHELEHAVGLHVIAAVKARIVTAYVAAPGEPLGFEQAEDTVARQHFDDWHALAADVGHLSDAVLVGLPLQNGAVYRTALAAVEDRSAVNPGGCAGPVSALDSIYGQIAANTDELSGTLALSDPDGVISNALIALRDQCFPGFTLDFIAVHAAVAGVSEASIIANLTPEELALVDNTPFVDGMFAYVSSRRRHMRDVEASFQTATGQPWAQLRYYSTEEAADDSSVSVLTEIGREPRALGDFFVKLTYTAPAQAACNALISDGMVAPYGEDLLDDHHASCWRAYHVDALVDGGVFARATPGPAREITRAPRFKSLPARPRIELMN